MSDTDIYWTFQTAAIYGGSFIKRIAAAGIAGDFHNKRRIMKEFYELERDYGPTSDMHRILRNREAA
jgi:hypothetical protein